MPRGSTFGAVLPRPRTLVIRNLIMRGKVTLLNLGMAGFAIAWLAVACYALAYLMSH
jgi:hypothetical protein